eukprot:CAMPEP_0116100500 /NCGR_PEP_ID=MMETSP0327-20121206/12322_1 /TAXON_ID=44447 /ORGANISM="Pseudo-nitzschia delicatissima, Strain B596" /LENGTH=432 /DNA_ID=CAMNT_0003592423 /DNA_START=42 /DNA_END=1340 /DNA_ORIENTATION=-
MSEPPSDAIVVDPANDGGEALACATSGETTTTSKTMMGFVVSKPGDTHGSLRKDVPIPQPKEGEALIHVLRAGVCNTDLEILEGYMGFTGVLGHEFVGTVERVETNDESLRKSWVGKRVCGDINVGCDACGVCKNFPVDRNNRGTCPQFSRNHCPNRTVLGILNKHGTMAEYLTLPLRNLHVVPDHVSDECAVFAEPLAAACRIVEQNLVRYLDKDDESDKIPPDKVAILGDGKLGLMIAEVLGREHSLRCNCGKSSGAEQLSETLKQYYPKPVLFGKHSHKLELVEGTSGVDCKKVTECVDSSSFTGVSSQHEHAYDVVVDATGSPAGLKLAAGMCRPMGTLVLKSTCASGLEQFNAAPFVIDELRVVGSRCGPIDRALELLALEENSTNVQPLRVEKYITKTFPLEEAEAAIKCAAERSTMKVQIVCSSN